MGQSINGVEIVQTDVDNIESTTGAIDDAAATGVVSNIKTIMAYVKQTVTNLLAAVIVRAAILLGVEDLGEAIGNFITGRSVTATLHVSPNGDDSDGSSVSKAFTTITGAIAAASTNANELTLILVHPGTYDIDTTGDPTFTGNYVIRGSYRNWAIIKNDHAGATSVMKFTGKVALENLTFDCGSGTNNGVIISGSSANGARLECVYFECELVTGAQTALEISGTIKYTKMHDILFHGVLANTKGLLLDDCKLSVFECLEFHECLTGIQVTNIDSDELTFQDILFHQCTLALDLDAGNEHIFEDLQFFSCTTNIDDEVGDHQFTSLRGAFKITTEPDDFIGVAVDTGNGADTWSGNIEVRAAITAGVPFSIIGISLEAGTSEKYRLRLSADGGVTWFKDFQFEGVALGSNKSSLNFPSGTGFIFNKGTQIVAQSKSESAGVDGLDVWLEIQEI